MVVVVVGPGTRAYKKSYHEQRCILQSFMVIMHVSNYFAHHITEYNIAVDS